MQYMIEDFFEADYGCEERPEGAPLMCCLSLAETGNTAEAGSTAETGSTAEAGSKGNMIFCNIPDSFVKELHLQKGQILSEEELRMMKEGRMPDSHMSIRRTEEDRFSILRDHSRS